MIGQRANPLILILETDHYHLVDALLSLPISGFILFGVLGLKKLLINADSNQLAL
jgi:hypothetical protein